MLVDKTQRGCDAFGAPVYDEVEIKVNNVLVAPASSTDITDALSLYGKKAVYTLAIPKGDPHIWTDKKVKFFGETWQVFGLPTIGIESQIPLDWNMKVMVERYG